MRNGYRLLTFDSIVNKNPDISNVQKFRYLKSLLRGEIAGLIVIGRSFASNAKGCKYSRDGNLWERGRDKHRCVI